MLRRFGRFVRIKLDPAPRIKDLVVLELKAELIAGSLQVSSHAVGLCHSTCTDCVASSTGQGLCHRENFNLKTPLPSNISIEQGTNASELTGMCSPSLAEHGLRAQ